MSKLLKKEPLNLIALGGLVVANVITPLDLESEAQDWANGEIKWLFSAVDNFLAIYQTVQEKLEAENSRLIKKYAGNVIGSRYRQQEMEKITPQVWQQELEHIQPIQEPIPPQAEVSPQANNRLLTSLSDYELQNCGNALVEKPNLVNRHLKNLKIFLNQETLQGEAGKGNVLLQNQINLERLGIMKVLQEMARLINDAYGIKVTSPDQLVELLSQQ